MMRQYGASRWQGGDNPLRVGTVAVGTVFYIQDWSFFHARHGEAAVCRNPWMVEAFLNGTVGASRRNRDTGLWESTYRSGRSDMAVVRSLRDGRRQHVAVRVLALHEELGLARGDAPYPTLPDLRFYHHRRCVTRPGPALDRAA